MKKRFAVIVAIILCFSMTGCGNKSTAKEIQETENNVSNEIYEGSTESESDTEDILGEDSREIIKSKDYEIDGDSISFSFSKDKNEEYYLSIGCQIEEPWKAAYAYTAYGNTISNDEFQKLNPMLIVTCGDAYITSAFSFIKQDNGENEYIDATEWCSDKLENEDYEEEDVKAFNDKLTEFLIDFLELK